MRASSTTLPHGGQRQTLLHELKLNRLSSLSSRGLLLPSCQSAVPAHRRQYIAARPRQTAASGALPHDAASSQHASTSKITSLGSHTTACKAAPAATPDIKLSPFQHFSQAAQRCLHATATAAVILSTLIPPLAPYPAIAHGAMREASLSAGSQAAGHGQHGHNDSSRAVYSDVADASNYSSTRPLLSDDQAAQAGDTPMIPGTSKPPPNTPAAAFKCSPLSLADRVDAYGDLGGYTHRIATSSPEAQRLFDQGLMLAYNFNQPEALRSFRAGLKYDPNAPLLHWGVAYALGPYLNKVAAPAPADGSYPTFTKEEQAQGQKALDTARRVLARQIAVTQAELADYNDSSFSEGGDGAGFPARVTAAKAKLTQLRKDAAYVKALAAVYDTGEAYGPVWREATAEYADALAGIAARDPADADAAAFAAEALANLSPWDFHDEKFAPKPLTPRILGYIENSLERNPKQPLALHLMVHVVEASKPGRGPGSAGRAEAAADILADAYPTFDHLVHMPSHTYLRVGRWHDSVVANAKSLAVEESDAKKCLSLVMPVHQVGMLLYTAAMGGDLATAEDYGRQLANYSSTFGPNHMTDGRDKAILPLIYTRFAKWDNLSNLRLSDLSQKADGVMLPPGADDNVRAAYHYLQLMRAAAEAEARGVTPELRNNVVAELNGLQEAVSALPPDPLTKPGQGIGIWSTAFQSVGNVLVEEGHARLAALDKNWDGAVGHMQKALALEQPLGYTEPPRLLQPPRQCLGWALLQAGRPEEAAEAYRKDLSEFVDNPWSLVGLKQALLAQGAQQQQLVASVAPSSGRPISSSSSSGGWGGSFLAVGGASAQKEEYESSLDEEGLASLRQLLLEEEEDFTGEYLKDARGTLSDFIDSQRKAMKGQNAEEAQEPSKVEAPPPRKEQPKPPQPPKVAAPAAAPATPEAAKPAKASSEPVAKAAITAVKAVLEPAASDAGDSAKTAKAAAAEAQDSVKAARAAATEAADSLKAARAAATEVGSSLKAAQAAVSEAGDDVKAAQVAVSEARDSAKAARSAASEAGGSAKAAKAAAVEAGNSAKSARTAASEVGGSVKSSKSAASEAGDSAKAAKAAATEAQDTLKASQAAAVEARDSVKALEAAAAEFRESLKVMEAAAAEAREDLKTTKAAAAQVQESLRAAEAAASAAQASAKAAAQSQDSLRTAASEAQDSVRAAKSAASDARKSAKASKAAATEARESAAASEAAASAAEGSAAEGADSGRALESSSASSDGDVAQLPPPKSEPPASVKAAKSAASEAGENVKAAATAQSEVRSSAKAARSSPALDSELAQVEAKLVMYRDVLALIPTSCPAMSS